MRTHPRSHGHTLDPLKIAGKSSFSTRVRPARGLQMCPHMEPQRLVQAASPKFSSIPAQKAAAPQPKDEPPPRVDEKDISAAADREIYDNIACTD